MPVARVCSLSRSITRTLSTTAAGRLFSAVLWSLKKKVRPPMVILSISSPLNFTLPSSVISMPGIRCRRSLSMALEPTRKEEALNSTVSFLTTMGLPTSLMTAACRYSSSCCSLMVPKSVIRSRKYRSFTKGLYPIISTWKVYWPSGTSSNLASPLSLERVKLVMVVSLAGITYTEANGTGSLVSESTTVALISVMRVWNMLSFRIST